MTPLRFGVVGSPVAHSKSPRMHAAAYAAHGMPHTYERLETSEAELAQRIEALRDGTFAGLNVTVPHKARVLALVDEVDASAQAVSAGNTLVRVGERRVRAYNTDVPALAEELGRLGAAVAGGLAVVLGNGGAARAAVAALARLGAAEIVVRSRATSAELEAALVRAARTSAPEGANGPALTTARLVPDAAVDARARVFVQATSCGMSGGPPGDVVARAVAWTSVRPDAVALDVVYGVETDFLRSARGRGIPSDDGLGMLAAQGALAFGLWFGLPPPRAIMRAALEVVPGA